MFISKAVSLRKDLVFLIGIICLLYGCTYVQPTLVKGDVADTDRLTSIAKNFNKKKLTIELQSSNGDVLVLHPLDSRVPWQVLAYKAKRIQQLIYSTVDYVSWDNANCKTIVEVVSLGQEADGVGLGFWKIYIKGNFRVANSCTKAAVCDVKVEYLTDDFYLTKSSKNKRYSEAIIGVILKAVVAAQKCDTES